jgi:hypothetical protein
VFDPTFTIDPKTLLKLSADEKSRIEEETETKIVLQRGPALIGGSGQD